MRNSKTKSRLSALLAVWVASAGSLMAQQTYEEMEHLTVNENVTTVITASEKIKFVDVSTNKVVSNKPIENVVFVKPKEATHEDGAVLGIVTIVTERYRTQYALIYTSRMEEAVSDKVISPYERQQFNNPTVSMSTEEMARFARRIWNSPAKYRNVCARKYKAKMRLNNIYSVDDYFFIDFSVENHTNLQFEIDQLRFKLTDKRKHKATNVQEVDLQPVFQLEKSKKFKHGYRNVVVLKKMTFPNDKVLTIEMSEKQISGRTLTMTIDYEDVLAADSFDNILLKEE